MSPEATRLGIPPCPPVLGILMQEAGKSRQDPALVRECLSDDEVLSAALLVAVNSPLVGRAPRVHRIEDAIAVAGIARCAKLAAGLLLSRTIAGLAVPGLGGFWDRITEEGLAIGYVARELGVADFDDAQLYGLFRHCAVPLLAARFGDYARVYRAAEPLDDADMPRAERALCGVDHASVGALFAQAWGLPGRICVAIARHHDRQEPCPHGAASGADPCKLVAVGALVDACIASLRCALPGDRTARAVQAAADLLGVSPAMSRSLRVDIALLLGSDLAERLPPSERR